MYPERNPGALSEFSLMSWPGLKAFSTATAGTVTDRGMETMGGVLYKVTDQTLYSVSKTGTQTSIGTISGVNRCGFAKSKSILVIVTGAFAYTYDGTTLTRQTYTFSPTSVTYLNNQFIFGADDGQFYVTNAGSMTVNPLNVGEPQSDPDVLSAPYAFNQLLYLVSSSSIEPWDNTGIGNPPFERIDGAIIEDVGASSVFGITNTPKFMYFMGTDGVAYRVAGYNSEPLTMPGQRFEQYDVSRAVLYSLTFCSQQFVVFQFPEATWAFNETVTGNGEWFELDDRGNVYNGTSYCYCYDKHLMAVGGDVLELDKDTHTNNGNYIAKERTLAVIAGESFGKPRQRLEMSKMYLSLEAGIGGGELMVEPSYDGGKTWGTQKFIDLGALGDFEQDVEWCNMHQFKQMVVRLRKTDDGPLNLYAASIDLREAGE